VQALREVPVRNLEANVEPAPPRAPIWGPLPGRKLHLYVVGSDTGRTEAFSLTTNSIGQLDIEIDALANRITSGDLSATFAELDLTGRDDEFFAWAASSPGLAAGIENNLTSNVLQFTVKRDAAKG
jgi:hypothetical protein